MELLREISEALQKGDNAKVGELTQQAIDEGMQPKVVLDDGLIAGMDVIGKRFRNHEIFLPDVLLSARAMYAGMDLLKPLFLQDEVPSIGKVVLGTVIHILQDQSGPSHPNSPRDSSNPPNCQYLSLLIIQAQPVRVILSSSV